MYNVVLQYTDQAGGYEGVRYWTSFKSKAKFIESYPKGLNKLQKVIAEGVTQDKAIELSSQTPVACERAACLEEATNPTTGKVNPKILEMKIATVASEISKKN